MYSTKNSVWIFCPVCGSKTRNRIREDTILKNYPLYCPKCKRETLINAKELWYHKGDSCWYNYIPFPCGESGTGEKRTHRSSRSREYRFAWNSTPVK